MTGGARGIQSIEVSGRILKAFVQAGAPMMLKDLAQAAEITPAQCHAYLTSLRHTGFVHQDPSTGRYCMGPFAMRLGIGWLRGNPLSTAAIRELKTLTESLGHMSLIAVWGAFGPTVVHVNEGRSPLLLNIRQGTLFSVTGTASGRVFATYGQAEDLEERVQSELETAVQRRALGQPLSRTDFEAELRLTRDQGFCRLEGAPIPRISAVSAPIFDSNGTLAFAATLVETAADMRLEDDSVTVRELLRVTRSLSEEAARRDDAATPSGR